MSKHVSDAELEPRRDLVPIALTLDESRLVMQMLNSCVMTLLRAAAEAHGGIGMDPRADTLTNVIVRLHVATRLVEAEAMHERMWLGKGSEHTQHCDQCGTEHTNAGQLCTVCAQADQLRAQMEREQ